MNLTQSFHRRLSVPSLLFAIALSGCSLRESPPPGGTEDRSFISYWAAESEDSGLRLAVKDLIDVRGHVTTAGSEYFDTGRAPATEDAACLAIARERGVKIVGKTNLTEFAISTSGINTYFGTPENTVVGWRRLIPGGSSSGSAVAVRNGLADVALGTDTAGSIRIPAACCGIVGLKTTFGLVPLDGVYPISPRHLDTVGPMARDIQGTVRGMELLQRGFAAKYRKEVADHPTGKSYRIARLYLKGTRSLVDRAIDRALMAAGFEVVFLTDDFRRQWEQAQSDGKTVAAGDAWWHNQRYQRQKGVTTRTKAVLLLGQVEYATNYVEAVERKAAWQRVLRGIFREVDLIALPTMQRLPPKIPWFDRNAVFEAEVFAIQNTAAVNFAGNPALALPVPLDVERRDVSVTSLQLIGPAGSEARLLNAGRLVESKSE